LRRRAKFRLSDTGPVFILRKKVCCHKSRIPSTPARLQPTVPKPAPYTQPHPFGSSRGEDGVSTTNVFEFLQSPDRQTALADHLPDNPRCGRQGGINLPLLFAASLSNLRFPAARAAHQLGHRPHQLPGLHPLG
jgi:hypothetical protein